MRFTIAQDVRIGARPYQQDRVGHWSTGPALLMVVADGMGGHLRGDVAAQVALDSLALEFRRDAKPRLADPDRFLTAGLRNAHLAILQEGKRLQLPEAPATVIVACVIQDGQAFWNHVGDSRLYHFRAGRMLARTRDHTRVQQLIDEGRIREEAVPSHPDRNKLLQCLGGPRTPKIEPATHASLAKDDILLLCSDGLWGPLTPRQILMGLLSRDLAAAVAQLASLAETRAGSSADNISVLALAWGEDAIDIKTEPLGPGPGGAMVDAPTLPQPGAEKEIREMSDKDIDRAVAEIRTSVARGKPEGGK